MTTAAVTTPAKQSITDTNDVAHCWRGVSPSPKAGCFFARAQDSTGYWEEFFGRDQKTVECFEEYRKLIIESDS